MVEHHDPVQLPRVGSTLRDDVIVKNTFIDLDEHDDSGDSRRSCSVPRMWKPGTCSGGGASPSGSSFSSSTTAAWLPSSCEGDSDRGEESDLAEDLSDAVLHTKKRNSEPAVASVWTLEAKLAASAARLNPEASIFLLPSTSGAAAPECPLQGARLNPQARAFEPVVQQTPLVPQEALNAIAAATLALQGVTNVSAVKVASGMNLVTVVAEVGSTGAQGTFGSRETLRAAKDALLAFTATSEKTYILGYASETAFKDLCASGFSTTIATVPAEHQETACWDTYQSGFCPRRSTCRWCHPGDADLTTVRVILKKTAQ